MASQTPKIHFVLFPFMAQGHMIPMVDIAKILVQQNVVVTLVTTPHNATRFKSTFVPYIESGFHLRLVEIPFPFEQAGLPKGCENLDMLPSLGTSLNIFTAMKFLMQPLEKLFEELTPTPSCIISDLCLPYTNHLAKKFNIPRISFAGVSCFCQLCLHNLQIHKVRESITDEKEYFFVPGIPDKIEMTLAQTPSASMEEGWEEFGVEMVTAEMDTYGAIMNTFEELEPAYASEYKKVRGGKVWCIGPVSLSNKDHLEKAQRGNKNASSIDEWQHQKWLDSQKPGSVIYACFGSICNLTPLQLLELGLALEASKRPFIWVIRESSNLEALEKLINENGFEERTKGVGLVIKGWAPQLVILGHPSIGGFITHCGWNSILEAICAGVAMITWPLFADQFLNQNLVVHVLKVGVKVGVESPVTWGNEEKIGVLVKKEDVERAIEMLMDESSECNERRKRVREFSEMAKNAVEKGGSSYSNVTLLIQDIFQNSNKDI